VTTPVRTCVGCGAKARQQELLRFVAREGVLEHDPTGHAPGRGAYLHSRLSCFERAESRRSFARTLRRTVTVPPDLKALVERG
jgi:predicted RNA-binding protein YlxR (DUF448 family)